MSTVEAATNSWPKIGLREKTGITSDRMPNAGMATI